MEEEDNVAVEAVSGEVDQISDKVIGFADKAINAIIESAPRIIIGLIILIAGFWLIKKLQKLIKKIMTNKRYDDSLTNFITLSVKLVLTVLLLISIVGYWGFETASFLTLVGTLGLAVGLALQGNLANIAGGISLLVLKPYKDGHFVDINGQKGMVEQIQLFATKLITLDNKVIYIPNGAAANSNITNYTEKGILRFDLNVGISYESDIKLAKDIMFKVVTSHELALDSPEPFCVVTGLGDSSVNISARVYVKFVDYWTIYSDCYEKVKYELDANNISIPYPQREVSFKGGLNITKE